MQLIHNSLNKLITYIEAEEFKGYDPYDTLNSSIPFKKTGKLIPVLSIQFQKRNPINIRYILGITKEINPKAAGLLLSAYCNLYKLNEEESIKKNIVFLFNWLKENYSRGYSGYCWGYNFDWASPGKYIKAYSPNVVATSFVSKGIFEYYNLFNDHEALNILTSVKEFLLKDLHLYEDEKGLCFSYTTLKKDACFNASMLAAETLADIYSITKDESLLNFIIKAVDFVVSHQKEDGRWNYSIDISTGKEREQIDFHQGYILVSLYNILNQTKIINSLYHNSLEKGADFYYKNQFFSNGRSKWRLPKEYPVDIHNQSQGVITFSLLNELDKNYMEFAKVIAGWTIKNMQDKNGFFYYRIYRLYKNKIPYMRWSQAWMMNALTKILTFKNYKNV